MAILLQVDFPEEPTDGNVRYIPLQGDGLSDPSVQCVWRINSQGDASGGTHQIEARLDPTYAWVVCWVCIHVNSPVAQWDGMCVFIPEGQSTLLSGGGVNLVVERTQIMASAAAPEQMICMPPPMLFLPIEEPPRSGSARATVFGRKANVNLEDISFRGLAFGYRVDAPKHTPIARLFDSVPHTGWTESGSY